MVTLQPTLQMDAPKLWGRHGGAGLSCRVEVRGLVQRDQGGKGIKHGSGQGAGPTLSLCPSYLPMAQTWATVERTGRVVETLCPGDLSQEGGVRWDLLPACAEAAPSATALVINNCQEEKQR